MTIFYHAYNQTMAAVANQQALQAENAAGVASRKVDCLELDVERLLMITESLWNILQEKFGCSDDELLRRVMTIDLRDGRLDSRVAPTPPAQCPHCQRTMAKHRPLCLYCGKPSHTNLFQR